MRCTMGIDRTVVSKLISAYISETLYAVYQKEEGY